MKVEAAIMSLLEPLFEVLPLDQAMPDLVPTRPASQSAREVVAVLVETPELVSRPLLAAALWLYVDDIDRAHRLCQDDPSSLGSVWHGVVHRREGDFWNSRYWFRRIGTDSPADGAALARFVDLVETQAKANPHDLVDEQRREWVGLFEVTADRYPR